MGRSWRAIVVVLAVLALAGASLAPMEGLSGVGADGDARGGELEEPSPWTDSLDDMSHVYVPEGGLVNVEVAGGEARLKAGETEGWIASEVISCPVGFRYDLILLEAETPGSSYVQISVLDASKESSDIGFANGTIPTHVNVKSTDHSIIDLSASLYPGIRIQVNLIATDGYRPHLLAWSLYYMGIDEWIDDFLTLGKLEESSGINETEGRIELNLTKASVSSGHGYYEPFPALAMAAWTGTSTNNPNSKHTAYEGGDYFSGGIHHSAEIVDIDTDGFLDLLLGKASASSIVYWGNSTGRWSTSNSTSIPVSDCNRLSVGDVNGDKKGDVVFACTQSSKIFFNKGDRSFNSAPDITFTDQAYTRVHCGDLTNDGYDDILFTSTSIAYVFFGGPDGPGTTPNMTFSIGSCGDGLIDDLDGDGYLDIMLGGKSSGKMPVYLGGSAGIPTEPDYQLTVPGQNIRAVAAGDINGDGHKDLLTIDGSPTYDCHVFAGTAQGWSDSGIHTLFQSDNPVLTSVDIDKDGYDDIIDDSNSCIRIFMGGTSWPTAHTIELFGAGMAEEMAVAIPRNVTVGPHKGSITTKPISIQPLQKWDLLSLVGSVPNNTTMTCSVLDDSGKAIPGFDNITEWIVDLSPITTTNTIRISVALKSQNNWTTPVLDRLQVKWMDKGTWRDQFYGTLRTERTLNLENIDGELGRAVLGGTSPQLIFPSLRDDTGYGTSTPVFLDAGDCDYLSWAAKTFNTLGVAAADATDINGDGIMDVAFAVQRTADDIYMGYSPVFLGSPVGWDEVPDDLLSTVGATDVLLRDLNVDGHVDLVFAQEQDGTSCAVNSTLFWGDGKGWNATPDVQFRTTGASGVETSDFDGNGRLDLAFACCRDASSTSTDSMVFLQGATGFCGTVPSYRLPTRGAAAVAAGDVNGDGRVDLAFANSISGGSSEIDSYVYLGKAGGGFEATPLKLRTVGAEDVKLADVDGDGDLDAVFANMRNNVGSYKVDSYVYLNDGSGGFSSAPDVRLPTTGAVAVAVADLDGTGRMDLVFACQYDGTSYNVSSDAYLGGTTGWSATPDIVLPTVGASDVLVAHLLKAGEGGYMSKAITPEDPGDTGAFHTFKYTASIGTEQSGKIQLIDAITWHVLAETPLQPGAHEWLVRDAFKFKEHQSVRVVITASGLDEPGEFALDDLWLNWTPRAKRPPEIYGVEVQPISLLRLFQGTVIINVTDEYDPTRELGLTVEHRLNGTSTWTTVLFQGMPGFSAGAWRVTIFPKADAQVGSYDLRVRATDLDAMSSGYVEFPNALEVRNNVPIAPEVRILPANPITTLTLQASIVMPARDVESSALSYRYRWYCDGILVNAITTDTIPAALTERGQNWSVEVRAFDGLDESLPGIAWSVILNAPPQVKIPLSNPEIAEDTVDDQWLDLSKGFEDFDGDALSYVVNPIPQHIQVTIDPSTGKVTLHPEADWSGQESITFVASDGELSTSQTVLVTVTPVNDAPRIVTMNGAPITSDPIALTVDQGERLVVTIGAEDVEGDELVFSVNTTSVTVDEATGTITFEPGNEAVGTLRFALSMYDVASPEVKVRLNFTITVVNVNDPMSDPRIINPKSGDKFKTNVTFSLIGACTDPDTVFGQVLNYTWWWNGTNLIGYGSSLTWNFSGPGTYVITLNVTDGEFSKDVSVEITIEPKEIPTPPPPPPEEDGGEGLGLMVIIGILVVLIIIGGGVFLVMSKRREEAREEEEVKEEKREAIKHMAKEVKATADELEHEVKEARAAKPAEVTKVVIETRGADGQVVVSSTGVPEQTLAVQPKETEAASADVQRLFKEMETKEPQMSTEDAEAMRLEGLKRKYQNAIGRLPYGIPAPELKDRDWVELAAALATGQKKETPDGRELTLIEGRWYYSDVKDASSFLTEHGARPKAEPKKAAAAPTMDKATILAKLEERLALGEISEETYKQLRKKYEE